MPKRDRDARVRLCKESMQLLLAAHKQVGGALISAVGTGTYDCNLWANEIQAGSYALMDTAYSKLGLPFRQALSVLATVISVSPAYAVGNCGLKSLGLDHGNPSIDDAHVLFCSVEHLTFVCTPNQDEAGPNNNWMAPDEAHRKMDGLFAGCMRGRTLYVIPYCMGPIDSPYARCGVEISRCSGRTVRARSHPHNPIARRSRRHRPERART